MNTGRRPNRLINSSSPYLLQHAYNPVEWYEWDEEALARAKKEDKPILISIGYSACHWCHVMERECFEQEDIASLMNEYFICIKVDREERPDLDHVYMEAVQAMGINGGWPLNVFLTPDQSPFYGGTYFPPQRWSRILIDLNKVFRERRQEINDSAEDLRRHLNVINSAPSTTGLIDSSIAEKMYVGFTAQYDHVHGGIDKAPKFIMPSIWQFFLRYHQVSGDDAALEMVRHTLTKVACGGIYDQIGGGFARYSVDGQWFVPHFEKMLYDNAQLISLYTEAWQVTGDPLFRAITEQTVAWLFREMTHPEGGFYSALDADSEGEEGKFYCWTAEELKQVNIEADEVLKYFGITEDGNWEHGKNILLGKPAGERPEWLKEVAESLLKSRSLRIRPGLDDKIITSWNSLTIKALADAGVAFNKPEWIDAAKSAYTFIVNNLISGDKLYRSFRKKHSSAEAFLDDYAALIQAEWSLYEATFDFVFLEAGVARIKFVLEAFSEESGLYFNYTSKFSGHLITVTRELYDNVIPSSNAMMCMALIRGAALTGNEQWKSRAEKMITGRSDQMNASPGYMSAWGMALLELQQGHEEVVILGKDALAFRLALGNKFRPFTLFTGAAQKISPAQQSLPLFQGRSIDSSVTTLYICRNQTCRYPVTSVAEAESLLGAV